MYLNAKGQLGVEAWDSAHTIQAIRNRGKALIVQKQAKNRELVLFQNSPQREKKEA
jgi:hypothetical protein